MWVRNGLVSSLFLFTLAIQNNTNSQPRAWQSNTPLKHFRMTLAPLDQICCMSPSLRSGECANWFNIFMSLPANISSQRVRRSHGVFVTNDLESRMMFNVRWCSSSRWTAALMAALIKFSSGALGSGVAIVTGKNLLLAYSLINLLAVSACKECLE